MKNDHLNAMLNKAMDYCSRSEKCEFDVRRKLNDWQAESTVVDDVIDALYSDQFIDHSRYARAYVNDAFKLKLWGRIKIRVNLKMKNIASSVINEALLNIDETEYLDKIMYLITSRHKKALIDNDYKFKAVKSLYSRGYESELVLKAIALLQNQLDSDL